MGHLDDGIFEIVGDEGHARSAAGVATDLIALLHIGEAVIGNVNTAGVISSHRPSPVQRSWSIHTFTGSSPATAFRASSASADR